MQAWKIEHFTAANPRSAFPRFRSLPPAECAKIRAAWRMRIGVPVSDSGLGLLRAFQHLASPIQGASAEQAGFDPGRLLNSVGIRPKHTVYINWRRFDEIDEMASDDFARSFSDIWYPSTDDIDVFDGGFDWLLSVADYGGLALFRVASGSVCDTDTGKGPR